MKSVLMIHEVNEEVLQCPLSDYILAFDDGLYSQYKYIDRLREFDTEMIFFISTGIVADADTVQSDEDICCERAHEYFFDTQDTKHYMNWSQIKKLLALPKCTVGGHSHNHPNLREMSLKDRISTITSDTKLMCKSFMENLTYVPVNFAYPYNYRDDIYDKCLEKHCIRNLYGDERIDINELY